PGHAGPDFGPDPARRCRPGVDRRSRSARLLEKFLSGLFLRTSEERVSNDSKGLGLPGAKKRII
ncbi:MAG: hypothetical protein OYG32_04980, partial [Rhodospirillaceae bacterium]|nr:hypothetical protein [Rhodospirillaceae bacterium]